ncbi:MAG: HupE/UreJ family protein [Capsulimonadales bacterium]|nr:HupE/UreJ family protein [Capsulimonadales bacterium]
MGGEDAFADGEAEAGLPKTALAGALFLFNVGVEIGQATIILAVAPPLALLASRQPKYHRPTVLVAASLIGFAGVRWLVTRLIG